MNVNIVPPGASFTGVGRYLMHDAPNGNDQGERINPKTRDRLEWSTTRNCVSADAEAAFYEMWRTADEQKFLQKQAGHKPHGCVKPVKHLDLAWRTGEAVTREEMEDAADDYLLSMGWGEHQAVYICHNDKAHRHLHIVLNKVHPVHGMTMDDFQDRIRSQPWAHAYEVQRGEIQSPARVGKDYATKRKPKNHSVPPGIEREGRKQEEEYVRAWEAHVAADRPHREMLTERHRDERDQYIASAKEDFREARRAAYHDTRAKFTDAWREHFEAAKVLRKQARALAQWHDKHGVGTPAPSDLAPKAKLARAEDGAAQDPVALVEHHLKQARKELAAQQSEARRIAQEDACKAVFDQRGQELQAIKQRQAQERAELRAMEQADKDGKPIDLGRLREILTGSAAGPTDPNQLMRQLQQANDNATPLDVRPPSNDNRSRSVEPVAVGDWLFLEPAIVPPTQDRSRPEHALAEGLRALLQPDSPFQQMFAAAQRDAQAAEEQRLRHREDLASSARITRTASMDEVQMDALEKLQKRAERAEKLAATRPVLSRDEQNRRDDTEQER